MKKSKEVIGNMFTSHEKWDSYNIKVALYQVMNLKLGLIKPHKSVTQETLDNNARYALVIDNEIRHYYAYKDQYKLTSRFE